MLLNLSKTFARSIINKYSSSTSSSQYIAYDLSSSRSLIKVKGQDASKYLQNLITNDINKLQTNNVIYAMILNNRGRVLYDVFVYRSGKQADEYLVEYDASFAAQLIKFLNVYRIKKKVDLITNTESKLYALVKQDNTPNQAKPFSDDAKSLVCELDPRCAQLGFRCIVESNQTIESNRVKLSSDLAQYRVNLYKNGVAENHQDISYENAIPLEYNIVLMNGVSFSKGCYLGQELIAKTHHTGVIRKRIMPIRLKVEDMSVDESQRLFKQDNSIINLKTGKQIGKLRNIVGKYGIAMLRLNELDKNNLALVDVSNANHLIDFHIPDYWYNDENLIKSLNEKNLI